MIYATSVSFGVGILLGEIFEIDSAVAIFLILICTSLSLILRKEVRARKILLCVIFLAIGILRLNFAQTSPDTELVKNIGGEVSLTGEIADEPDERDQTARYVLKIDDSPSQALLVKGRFPKFEYGDQVSVSGKIEFPENFESENGIEFDYVSYLAKDKIHFMMYRPEVEKIESGGNIIFKNLYRVKNYFIQKVSLAVPEPNASLVNGLIFGAKQSLGKEILDTMKNVGLIHIVAISGYNLTIIAVATLYITSRLVRRNLGLTLSASFIILFALMVGFGSTVIRASIMAVVAILAKYLGRPGQALRTLFLAGLMMILWNPLILKSDPSFQLSFMATLGLIIYSPMVENFLFNSWPKKLFGLVPNKLGLREIISSTFAVQIFLLPMLIKMSGIFSLVSFVLNILILPLVPWAMLFGFLTGAFGSVSLVLSSPFGVATYVLTQIILRLAEIAEKIPLAFLQVGSLPTFVVIVFYIFYAWAFWKFSSITDQFKLEKKSST